MSTCPICKIAHGELPLSFGFAIPDYVNSILKEAPWDEERVKRSEDWCIVDDRHFYVRGCLELPLIGSNEKFVLGIWTTLSEDNFDRMMEMWNTEGRENEPAYLGSCSNSVPFYPETRTLKLSVQTRSVGERPLLILDPTDHPLAIEQRQGIAHERMVGFAQLVAKAC